MAFTRSTHFKIYGILPHDNDGELITFAVWTTKTTKSFKFFFLHFLRCETVCTSQVTEYNGIDIPEPVTAKFCFQVMLSSKLQLNICFSLL